MGNKKGDNITFDEFVRNPNAVVAFNNKEEYLEFLHEIRDRYPKIRSNAHGPDGWFNNRGFRVDEYGNLKRGFLSDYAGRGREIYYYDEIVVFDSQIEESEMPISSLFE